jgi:rhodanese-related sulfurtransferase
LRKRLVRCTACAVAIFVVAGSLGLLVNAVSSAGIPLVAESAQPGRTVELTEARLLFDRGEACFIDARPHGDFAAGHIAGAVSVPLAQRAAELDRLRRELPRTRPIIAYCEGGECASALELSAWLSANGWRDVRVLGDGYPVWQAAGFPTATGEGS